MSMPIVTGVFLKCHRKFQFSSRVCSLNSAYAVRRMVGKQRIFRCQSCNID